MGGESCYFRLIAGRSVCIGRGGVLHNFVFCHVAGFLACLRAFQYEYATFRPGVVST